MKRFILLFFSMIVFDVGFAQKDSTTLVKEIKQFQDDLNKEYKNAETSPLSKEKRENFTHLNFFPIDPDYVVTAKFIRTSNERIFAMPTTGNSSKQFVKYGEAQFLLKGKQYRLNIYQSIDLASQRKYRDYLFIPFRDATSGKETYGGGRYIDLTIPRSDTFVINFNMAYHPYCAYAEGFNCPIPPRENYLAVKVEAGVRF